MSEKGSRRKIDMREMRLYLFATDAGDQGQPVPAARLHIVRDTVNGRNVGACDYSRYLLSEGVNYWNFPALNWMLANAPICRECMDMLVSEGYVSHKYDHRVLN